MKKVLLVIASEGYQPIEYGEPKRILEASGFVVTAGSDKLGVARILIKDIDVNSYDALFFIGGPGALEHLDNEESYELLRAWQKTSKPYGAICVSPRILAKAGVLKNKRATGWDGDGELAGIFKQCGVEYVKEDVVVDSNVITANGPAAAEEFGKKIVGLLSKE